MQAKKEIDKEIDNTNEKTRLHQSLLWVTTTMVAGICTQFTVLNRTQYDH